MRFEQLTFPPQWKDYWTKYPHGMTILESLIDWVTKTNDLIDNVNDWNNYLNDFVATFDENLKNEVTETVQSWIDSGYIEVVISAALQTQIDEVELQLNNEVERIDAQLADIITDVSKFGAHDNTEIGFETFDNTISIQNALDSQVLRSNTIFLSGKEYKITSPLQLNGKTLKGNGKGKTVLNVYGCDAIHVLSDYCHIEDITIRAYDLNGEAYPRVNVGVHCKGTDESHINYNVIKNVVLVGFATSVQWDYTWNSVLDNVNTIFCLIGLKTFGQTVNNYISNSGITTDNTVGTKVISLEKDGLMSGEGLTISNSLIASGEIGISGEDFLALKLSNCIVDLIGKNAFSVTDCSALSVTGSWIYSQDDTFHFKPLSVVKNLKTNINGNTIISVNAEHGNYIADNNEGVNFVNNTIQGLEKLFYLETTSKNNLITNNNFIQNSKSGNAIHDFGTENNISNNGGDSHIVAYTNESQKRGIHFNNTGDNCCIGTWSNAPTLGTYKRGDYYLNVQPSSGGKIGGICVEGGTPGVWADFGIIGAKKIEYQPNSTATTLEELLIDFNSLRDKILASGLM